MLAAISVREGPLLMSQRSAERKMRMEMKRVLPTNVRTSFSKSTAEPLLMATPEKQPYAI